MHNQSFRFRCLPMALRVAISAGLALTTPYVFAQDELTATGTSTGSQSPTTLLPNPVYMGKFRPGLPDGHGGELSKGQLADLQGQAIQKSMLEAASAQGENTECPLPLFSNGFEPIGLTVRSTDDSANEYVTTGGYLVRVQYHTISIQDPYRFNFVQHWGDPHENLNGKHVKDWGSGRVGWDSNRRTIVLDDGTKITMTAVGPTGVVETTSIYDGSRNVQIDNSNNTVTHYEDNLADTQARETSQYDGETAIFTTDHDTLVASYTDTHNENAAFEIINETIPIGTTGGCANPRQVNDQFP